MKLLKPISNKAPLPQPFNYDLDSFRNQITHNFHFLSNSIEKLSSTMISLIDQMPKKSSKIHQNTTLRQQLETDERFRHVQIDIPLLTKSSSSSQHQQISVFMGSLCKKVFEHGFAQLKNGNFDGDKVKVYCSQNILYSIIELVKQNNLSEEQLDLINTLLKEKILPYFACKYPLAKEEGENTSLKKLIIPKNNINDQQNDLIFRSKIKFEWRENKNYNKEIMKFLNYLISLSERTEKQFTQEMTNIFESVNDKEKTNEMHKFDPKFPNQNQNPEEINCKYADEDKKAKAEYKQKVASYTSYQIGSKISSSTKKFSLKQIQSANLELNDTGLVRVVTKWCEELQKYYQPQEILKREKPFRMRNGQLKFFEKQASSRVLSILLQRKFKQIKKYIDSVLRHSNHHQSKFAKKAISEEIMLFSKEQATVGSFAAIISRIHQNYLEGYLNQLIHGLVQAAKQFQMLSQLCKQKLEEVNQRNIDGFFEYKLQITSDTSSFVPNLVTFKIGDLLRCKCSSKQWQITALYRHISRINFNSPQNLKIVRVKDRLKKSTRDILVNMIYKGKILVEMQLAIKSDQSKFLESSSKFSHFLYELERSEFGPINQMCNIWVSKDGRAKIYRNMIERINKREKQTSKYDENCQSHILEVFDSKAILPFQCDSCMYFYYSPKAGENHKFCSNCQKKICILCLIAPQDQKASQKQQEILDQLPKAGKIKNIRNLSKQIKFVKFVSGKQVFLLQPKQNYSFDTIQVFDKQISLSKSVTAQQILMNRNAISKFFRENIMTSGSKKDEISDQIIKENFQLQNYLKECNTSQRNSIAIVNESISQSVFEKFSKYLQLIGDDILQKQAHKLNLSQNKIQSLDIIVEMYGKAKELFFNYNRIKSLPQNIEKWSEAQILQLNHNKFKDLHLQQIKKMKKLKQLVLKSNLIQKIYPPLGEVTQLQLLDLSQNKIMNLTEQILYFPNLLILNLQKNQIQKLPSTISRLTSLQILNLGRNQLEVLPEQISDLQILQQLYLDNNKLVLLPESIGQMKGLKVLSANSNKLTVLPQGLKFLHKLSVLNLSSNRLEKLPENLGNLSKLKYLNLSSNLILASLPLSCQELVSIEKLQIQSNALKLLPNFDRMTFLQFLNFSQNQITTLPNSICDAKNLQQIRGSSNRIVSLPESIGNLKKLRVLDLEKNGIQNLPSSFGDLESLSYLSCTGSSLRSLPQNFGNLSNLQHCFLSENKLNSLPCNLQNLTNLLVFKLDGNQITKLPESITELKLLWHFQIGQNKLKNLPEYFGKLKALEVLGMNQNQLNELPNSFGDLSSLKNLKISSNKLSWLHESFFKLKLTIFEFSGNRFDTDTQERLRSIKRW